MLGIEEIIKQSKETVIIILTGLSGIIANFVNRIRKGQEVSFILFITHLLLSGFVGLMAYLLLSKMMDGMELGFTIGIVCYSATKIIDTLDMITAKQLYNFLIDFIQYKIGEKKGKK